MFRLLCGVCLDERGKEEHVNVALVLLRSGRGWRGADRQTRGGAGSWVTAMTPPKIGLCYAVPRTIRESSGTQS